MQPFTYRQAADVQDAVATRARHRSDLSEQPAVDFLAGGTDLLPLMTERVRLPVEVIDLSRLPDAHPDLAAVHAGPDGARLGALARLSDVAGHAGVRQHYPVLVEALLASASPQVRNLATVAGNVLQRTRCGYFRDASTPCNKRQPGSGCPALTGQNRDHALLGASEHCIATYAGDLANALLVLDAVVHTTGPDGDRTMPLQQLHRRPGDTPELETQLHPGELITRFEVAPGPSTRRSHYVKVRERASFQWAIAAAAVALDLTEQGTVRQARVAVGGVATTPWRTTAVEQALLGQPLTDRLCREAGLLAADGAVPRGGNAYKVELIGRTVTRALQETAALP